MSNMRAETPTELVPTVDVALAAARQMAHERCDICGHRAYVQVMTADGPLAFCAHHFEASAVALARVSAVIHDIRDQLVATVQPGSA